MALKKKDFIEIEFTGKIRDTGEVFDSNTKEELEKLHKGHNHKIEVKPLVYCLGEGMFLQGIDEQLIGKEIGKHKIELAFDKAFGKRDSQFVKMVPMKVFMEHKVRPVQGMMMNFDGRAGKILSVSGGRVLIDFNHPLAGKDLIYEIDVKRKVEGINEKIKAFNDFIFRRDFNFEVKGKKAIYKISEKDRQLQGFMEMFKPKFKEIFDIDLELETERKEDKKPLEKEAVKR